ncbi:MAG: DUF2809 domain-containing protein [Calditrichaeota bacterium]|nr:DUF2809 domain-containing protein [Calditrichota bacterium]
MKSARFLTAVSLFLITPLGFLTKAYNGAGAHWVNDSLGGVLYVIFWCLAVYWLFPSVSIKKIAWWVFTVTCLLEFAQLWHPPFLQTLRSYYLGKVILGTTFVWSDIPHYAVGALIGWYWLHRIQIRSGISVPSNKNS